MFRRSLTRTSSSLCIPAPSNEPMKTFHPNTVERHGVDEALRRVRGVTHEIPCILNGKEIFTGNIQTRTVPHDHSRVAYTYHYADESVIQKAIESSLNASRMWSQLSFEDRAVISLRTAHLVATKYRYDILAATMIGQSKTVQQAEVDASVETVDFLRFNTYYAQEVFRKQPASYTERGEWNRLDYRPLEGFVYALTPFNFTAIAANLSTTPAVVGNTVLWKPSDNALLSNYLYAKILIEAGLPPGVVNFIPIAREHAHQVTKHPSLAGIAFTGSTAVFQSVWQQVANNLPTYHNFPVLVGECGGKNFHLVHPTASVPDAVSGTIRSAFEFSGQKCSACSRLYLPQSLHREFLASLVDGTSKLVMGNPEESDTFMGALIDEAAYQRNSRYIQMGKSDPSCTLLYGGVCDASTGWFVSPTIFQTSNPNHALMHDEIFGPILTVYVYPDAEWDSVVQLAASSKYGLTGSLYCNDRYVTERAVNGPLRHACGNLYVNDKSTGSVVGQQPFGGSRASGTNDKAGFSTFIQRWVSPRCVKETFKTISP